MPHNTHTITNILDEYINLSLNKHKELFHITLSYLQYYLFSQELCSTQHSTYLFENIKGLMVITYKAIPIYASEYLSDIKCKMCDKTGDFIEYKGHILCACEEHLEKVKMFHLLSLGGKNEL